VVGSFGWLGLVAVDGVAVLFGFMRVGVLCDSFWVGVCGTDFEVFSEVAGVVWGWVGDWGVGLLFVGVWVLGGVGEGGWFACLGCVLGGGWGFAGGIVVFFVRFCVFMFWVGGLG